MSPEQARGEEVDPRADIWAMCVVLYEAIAGCLPFDGKGYNAVMYAILTTTPESFMQLGVEEPELWEIIARGLERDRDRRWPSCAELHRALGDWLIARGVMHDVSGVSLHAGMQQHRASHVRTLESVRPVAASFTNERGASARSGVVFGSQPVHVSALWRRPRWVLPALAVLVSGAVSLAVWRGWSRAQVVPLRASTAASFAATRTEERSPFAGPKVETAPVEAVAVPSQRTEAQRAVQPSSPVSGVPAGVTKNAAPAQRKAQVNAANRPGAAAEKASPASKADGFKSPFD
jgi:serine/threonine-protein kinase